MRSPSCLAVTFVEGVSVGTVQDASPNGMVWLCSALDVPAVPPEVDELGQSGTVCDLHRAHDPTAARLRAGLGGCSG